MLYDPKYDLPRRHEKPKRSHTALFGAVAMTAMILPLTAYTFHDRNYRDITLPAEYLDTHPTHVFSSVEVCQIHAGPVYRDRCATLFNRARIIGFKSDATRDFGRDMDGAQVSSDFTMAAPVYRTPLFQDAFIRHDGRVIPHPLTPN